MGNKVARTRKAPDAPQPNHLKMKYRNTEEEKLDTIPKELEEYITLSIFDREKFERIKTLDCRVSIFKSTRLTFVNGYISF